MKSSLLGDPALLAFPPGDIFIETGLREGHTLNAAIQRGQFKALYSIEIDPVVAEVGRTLFESDDRVAIVTGDSRVELAHLCDPMSQTVFWLDAHIPGCPLLEELQTIVNVDWVWPPTILIDDAPLFDRDRFGHAGILEFYRGQLSDAFFRDDLPTWPTFEQIRAMLGDEYDVTIEFREARRVPWYQAIPFGRDS